MITNFRKWLVVFITILSTNAAHAKFYKCQFEGGLFLYYSTQFKTLYIENIQENTFEAYPNLNPTIGQNGAKITFLDNVFGERTLEISFIDRGFDGTSDHVYPFRGALYNEPYTNKTLPLWGGCED